MTKTIKSFTSSAHYFLTINDQGEAIDCSCPDHTTWAPNRKGGCKHMQGFNAEVARVQAFEVLRKQFDCRLNGQEATRRCYYEIGLGV